MAYFDSATVSDWIKIVESYLETNTKESRFDVLTGAQAWDIAVSCKVTDWAYKDSKVTDAHIKTALAKIFPNAIFKDKYHY